MKCPSCGAQASGKFCSSCGSPLKVEKCSSCGASVPPGSRFCTNCGKGLAGGGGQGKRAKAAGPDKRTGASGQLQNQPESETNSTMAWWVAGAMVVVALVALGYPALNRGLDSSPAGPGAPPGMGGGSGGAPPVDLSSMTLEDQGNTLFNRVMRSSSNGDVQDVEFFQPKAIVIYEQLDPQDPDGLYHFALLHMVGEEYQEALAKAQQGLADVPDYVLLLGVAAEASIALGDEQAARELYVHLLEVYDTELGMSRIGYDHHQPMFPAYQQAAQAFLNQG